MNNEFSAHCWEFQTSLSMGDRGEGGYRIGRVTRNNHDALFIQSAAIQFPQELAKIQAKIREANLARVPRRRQREIRSASATGWGGQAWKITLSYGGNDRKRATVVLPHCSILSEFRPPCNRVTSAPAEEAVLSRNSAQNCGGSSRIAVTSGCADSERNEWRSSFVFLDRVTEVSGRLL